MKINFFDKKCQSQTHRHEFGICDPPSPSENPAYLDTENPSDWIAIVENSQEIEVTFTAGEKFGVGRRRRKATEKRNSGIY